MKVITALALTFALTATTVHASPIGLVDQISNFAFNKGDELRLIKYGDDQPARWMKESEILEMARLGIKYMDITDYQSAYDDIQIANNWKPFIPAKARYADEVEPYIGNLTTTTMEIALNKLTSFKNRYYKSKWGAESCRWLIQSIRDLAEGVEGVSIKEFEHSWDQFSIIARIEGSNPELENELVIVGAHQDSVNLWLPSFGTAPGADDDGSGTVTILETFRTLIDNGFKPERPVEFHWYSAEEAGLLGSQAVAAEYKKQGKHVTAMLQNDMTGYIGSEGEVIGIVSDHVDTDLTNFLKSLVDTYAAIPYVNTECGYACSDHASWAKNGYPSAFTIETTFEGSNQAVHTTGDVISRLSFNHMKEFAKVATGFAVELSHKRSE
ncbi:hypothetical protein BGW37DRAFT_523171 [Umbelopsis sp. PMI_123]|nr:hypothetical protein BGW37DRAFT_523171 [Umbelopsis sp. PMI_123]